MSLSHAIKGVLFDKDGTLFDFHRTWIPILEEAALLAARGERALVSSLLIAGGCDPETGRAVSGGIIAAGDTHDLARVWGPLVRGWGQEELVARLDELFAAQAPLRSDPVTDLVALMRTLRERNLRVGVATNDSAASVLATIHHFDLDELVEFHCGYDSGHGAKPAPGMVHAFCQAVGLEPAEIVVVGDNLHDLDMGKSAGAGLLVGVLTGTSVAADLEAHADHVIASIVELPALLEREIRRDPTRI